MGKGERCGRKPAARQGKSNPGKDAGEKQGSRLGAGTIPGMGPLLREMQVMAGSGVFPFRDFF